MKIIRFLLFNWFTKSTVNRGPQSILGNKRLAVAIVELQNLASILFFPMLFSMILIVILQSSKLIVSDQVPEILIGIQLSLFSAVILNKDLFGGQSIVHRTFGYQVVNAKTGEPASKVRCFIRNITFVLWIIEVIPLLIKPKRRIGDWIAGTMVIPVPPSDPTEILEEMKQTRWTEDLKWTLLLSFIFIGLNVGYFTKIAFK